MCGYNPGHGTNIVKKLKKYSLSKLAKKGYRLVGDILEDVGVERTIVTKKGKAKKIISHPSFRDKIEAAKMVYERYEPVEKVPMIAINNNIHPVDLDSYAIDVTPPSRRLPPGGK